MEESTSKLFAQKIRELKGTQEGIQTLSHWVQFHRKKIGSIVRVWVKELGREGVQYAKRKLLLLYVANDVMQASRKKNKPIVDEFAKALPTGVKYFSRSCDAKGKRELLRMLGIWEERQVLSESFVAELRRVAEEGSGAGSSVGGGDPSAAAASSKKDAATPAVPVVTAAELEGLYEAVSTASHDDNDAQKQADALLGLETPRGSDLSVAVESVVLLKKRLETSIKARSNLVEQLRALLSHQRDMADTVSHKLEVASTRLGAARALTADLVATAAEEEPAAKRVKVEAS